MPDPMEISDNLFDAALPNPTKDGAPECSLPGIVAKALGWETCWEAPHRPGFWMLERATTPGMMEAMPLEAELHQLLGRGSPAQPSKEPAPIAPIRVIIDLSGEDWPYVAHHLRELAESARAESLGNMASGGGGGSHSVTVVRRNVSRDQYRREIEEWVVGGSSPKEGNNE